MKTIFTVAISVVLTVFILYWVGRADEVGEKSDSGTGSLKEAEIQYAQIIERAEEARLATHKEHGMSEDDYMRTSLGYRLKLVKSWIAYLNDPTKESPAEVIAENMLRTAQRDLIAAKGVNDRAPTDQSKADLSQCELKIELAGARVAIAKSLRNASPEEKLQWASMLEFELVYKFGTRSEVMLLAD